VEAWEDIGDQEAGTETVFVENSRYPLYDTHKQESIDHAISLMNP